MPGNHAQTKDEREKFAKLLRKKGLIYAAGYPTSRKKKIKSVVIKIIPNSIRPTAKRIYHTLRDFMGKLIKRENV